MYKTVLLIETQWTSSFVPHRRITDPITGQLSLTVCLIKSLPPLSADTLKKIRALYDAQIKPLVHQYW
jgi:hypothetical protein